MPDTDTPINLIPGRCQAARRSADAMLRVMGGEEITLRLSDPSTGDTSSQLGITPPTAEEVQINPAVVQAIPPAEDGSMRLQVMLSADKLDAIAESYGVTNISPWLTGSQGLVYRGRIFTIRSVTSNSFAGSEVLYFLVATE